MAKQKNRSGRAPSAPTPFEEARDELFQHIMRCAVVGSAAEDQKAWFDETMQYMMERYPEIGADQLGDLRKLGERFAQPPKKHEAADASAA